MRSPTTLLCAAIASIIVFFSRVEAAPISAEKRTAIDSLLRVSNASSLGATSSIKVRDNLVDVYDSLFNERELNDLLRFFETPLGGRYAQLQFALGTEGRARFAGGAPSSAELTVSDMRSIATALESYAIEHPRRPYPAARDLEELASVLAPKHIASVPRVDGWGMRLVYVTTADCQHYRLLSGGADGQIESANMEVRSKAAVGDDIIIEDSNIVLQPPSRIPESLPQVRNRALVERIVRISNAPNIIRNFIVEKFALAGGVAFEGADDRERSLSNPATVRAVVDHVGDMYERTLSESDLKELIGFFQSRLGAQYARVPLLMRIEPRFGTTTARADHTDVAKIQKTKESMRRLAAACLEYGTDNTKYPDVRSVQELAAILSPKHIRAPVLADAWGKPFVYILAPDRMDFRLVSGGPDGKIEPESLRSYSKPRKTDDIILEGGRFLEPPP